MGLAGAVIAVLFGIVLKNTHDIGSIKRIADMLDEKGMFSRLGEEWFDDYWMNYGKITVQDGAGNSALIKSLREFVKYRKGDVSKIVPERQNNEKSYNCPADKMPRH